MNEINDSIFEEEYFFKKISELDNLPAPDYVDTYVTDFCDWLYKCTTGKSSTKSKQKGKNKEKEIEDWRLKIAKNIFDSNWSLFYKGVSHASCKALEISDYNIRGETIVGKPDFIFINDTTSTACIVEIKYSNIAMPYGGWPNARAQLWLYSKIDALKKYKNIILYCETHGDDEDKNTELKSKIAFNANDKIFNQQNLELFLKYKSYENIAPKRNEFCSLEAQRNFIKQKEEFERVHGKMPF